ncbi:MAG: DNA polymerase IV [Actinobacteria bacterium]|nr:DNA polymerase IV [Actinomycetota bacterium]MCI0544518.1 DNA polymerase IV [Actinomycetota bacterium]MCI0679540.1 DNA polymerase IV [Actinomycetota bacterium]
MIHPVEPTILHADLDAFYASVEQMLDPSLQGRPVLVGGGIVVAASYEARAYGVRAPMPTREALILCPRAVVVSGSFRRYLELSDDVMAIFEDATPVVEQISVDEAFLDVSGTTHLLGSPTQIARVLRARVRTELGLPLSIGIASTKFLAKIASARAKPDGLVVVESGREIEFLHPLPVEALWGVGRVTAARLHRLGVATVGELAESPLLARSLGVKTSATLRELAWNVDPRPVRGGRRAGSVGSQQALGRGLRDLAEMYTVIAGLADRVGRRMRAKGRSGSTATLRVRFPGPRVATRRRTLPAPTASTAAIGEVCRELLSRALEASAGDPVTLIGVSMSHLTTERAIQLELALDVGSATRAGSSADLRRRALDDSIDSVRERFGRDLVRLGASGSGDDDFRRLAERS